MNWKINNISPNIEPKDEIQKIDLDQPINRFRANKRDSNIIVSYDINKGKKEEKQNNNNKITNKDNTDKKIYYDNNYKKINLFEFLQIKKTVEYYLNCSLKDITQNNGKEVNKANEQSLIQTNNEINININVSLKSTNISKIITKFWDNNEPSNFNVIEY